MVAQRPQRPLIRGCLGGAGSRGTSRPEKSCSQTHTPSSPGSMGALRRPPPHPLTTFSHMAAVTGRGQVGRKLCYLLPGPPGHVTKLSEAAPPGHREGQTGRKDREGAEARSAEGDRLTAVSWALVSHDHDRCCWGAGQGSTGVQRTLRSRPSVSQEATAVNGQAKGCGGNGAPGSCSARPARQHSGSATAGKGRGSGAAASDAVPGSAASACQPPSGASRHVGLLDAVSIPISCGRRGARSVDGTGLPAAWNCVWE